MGLGGGPQPPGSPLLPEGVVPSFGTRCNGIPWELVETKEKVDDGAGGEVEIWRCSSCWVFSAVGDPVEHQEPSEWPPGQQYGAWFYEECERMTVRRCRSVHEGLRCAGILGHDGDHTAIPETRLTTYVEWRPLPNGRMGGTLRSLSMDPRTGTRYLLFERGESWLLMGNGRCSGSIQSQKKGQKTGRNQPILLGKDEFLRAWDAGSALAQLAWQPDPPPEFEPES